MVTAQEMGKKGGSARSEAKTSAVRKNASQPRGKWWTAIAYEVAGVGKYIAFGVVLVRGAPPRGPIACHEWLEDMVQKHGVGLAAFPKLEFLQLASSREKVA